MSDAFLDPRLGIVLGQPWGAPATRFLLDHPRAALVTDEADIQVFEVDALPLGEVSVSPRFTFRLGELIAVSVALPNDEAEHRQHLIDRVSRAFDAPLEEADHGLFVAEDGATHVEVDTLDGEVTFREVHG